MIKGLCLKCSDMCVGVCESVFIAANTHIYIYIYIYTYIRHSVLVARSGVPPVPPAIPMACND